MLQSMSWAKKKIALHLSKKRLKKRRKGWTPGFLVWRLRSISYSFARHESLLSHSAMVTCRNHRMNLWRFSSLQNVGSCWHPELNWTQHLTHTKAQQFRQPQGHCALCLECWGVRSSAPVGCSPEYCRRASLSLSASCSLVAMWKSGARVINPRRRTALGWGQRKGQKYNASVYTQS